MSFDFPLLNCSEFGNFVITLIDTDQFKQNKTGGWIAYLYKPQEMLCNIVVIGTTAAEYDCKPLVAKSNQIAKNYDRKRSFKSC
jgi:hypothetical protein